ncbi:MAG: hypothetical protein KGZ51_04835 [Erysipelothrix sp.]|nr:hypothetical protein [Erysipelothrix sp.]
MKKIILLFISTLLIFTLVACSSKETPKEVVEKGISAIKNLDLIQIQKYFNADEISDENDVFGQDFDVENAEIFALMTKNLTYEIINVNTNDKVATVETKITNINMAVIMKDFITQALILAFEQIGETEVDEEEMQKQMEDLLIELLSKEDNEMITTEVDIELNEVDGEWKIDLNDELINALFGGLTSVVDEIQD